MKRKVGMLTFHRALNFGAALQAFALQKVIKGFGHSCSIVDFYEKNNYQLIKFPRTIALLRKDINLLLNLRSHQTSINRFATFVSKNLIVTDRPYFSKKELSDASLSYDSYVTGSDQVWHPHILERSLEYGSVFYLDFDVPGRRIAYGPSFGLDGIPVQYQKYIAECLARFDYLSCREHSGCEFIKQLMKYEVEQVLDPTLLLQSCDYEKISVEPSVSESYILLFPLEFSDRLFNLAREIKARLKRPIIAVVPHCANPRMLSFADKVVLDSGPSEFLGWIKNAVCVCTNSFHGTCFSIIYRKPFVNVPHTYTNTRLLSLLRTLGLETRQIIGTDVGKFSMRFMEFPKYDSVEVRLKKGISSSKDFLTHALD